MDPSLDEFARRFGHYRWVEQHLFEILGGWVPSVAEPEAKLLLRSHAYRHAWYSRVWEQRLPRTASLNPDESTRSAGDAAIGVLEALSALEATADRLAGAYSVVIPDLLAAYESEASGPAEPDGNEVPRGTPVERWLRIVAGELRREISEGQDLDRLSGGTAGPAVATLMKSIRQGQGLHV